MATLTVTTPSSRSAAENPIVLTIATGLITGGSNSYAQSRLTVTGLIGNNFSVNFSLTEPTPYSARFYAKEFPDQTNYFLGKQLKNSVGTVLSSMTTTQIAGSLADALQRDVFISSNYYVNYGGSTVVDLVAKNLGSRWGLDAGEIQIYNESGGIASSGMTLTQILPGNQRYQGAAIPDYSLYADVFVNMTYEYGDTISTSNFNRVSGLQLPYTIDNLVTFDVSPICKGYVSTPKPNLSYELPIPVEGYLRPFFIRYGESYPLIPNTNTKKKFHKAGTGVFWVMNASLNRHLPNNVSPYFPTQSVIGDRLTGGTFITTSPTIKQSSRTTPELLYFILEKNVTSRFADMDDLKLHCDVLNWDGTTSIDIPLNYSESTVLETGNTGNFGGLWIVNVSYNNIGLEEYETTNNKKIKKATFYMTSGAHPYMSTKTYSYPYLESSNKFGLCFQNHLGTYDCFEWQGLKEDIIERDADNITFPVTPNSNGSLTPGFKRLGTTSVELQKKITVNSGFLNSENFEWLKELLNSNEIYTYSDDYEKHLVLDSVKYSTSNANNENTIEATFIESYIENGITL